MLVILHLMKTADAWRNFKLSLSISVARQNTEL